MTEFDPNKWYVQIEDAEWKELPDYSSFLSRLENLEKRITKLEKEDKEK